MPTTHNDGLELAYQVSGEGPPLLIISGLSAERSFWALSRPLLKGFTLIEFDNRDIGKSQRAKAAYTAADMARDALAVLDASGFEKAHVIGHSMGGMIAQELAIAAPQRVNRLVLSNTIARNDLYTTEIMRLFKELRLQLDNELTFGAALTTFVLGMRTLNKIPLFRGGPAIAGRGPLPGEGRLHPPGGGLRRLRQPRPHRHNHRAHPRHLLRRRPPVLPGHGARGGERHFRREARRDHRQRPLPHGGGAGELLHHRARLP